jgi:hypothetical protein
LTVAFSLASGRTAAPAAGKTADVGPSPRMVLLGYLVEWADFAVDDSDPTTRCSPDQRMRWRARTSSASSF